MCIFWSLRLGKVTDEGKAIYIANNKQQIDNTYFAAHSDEPKIEILLRMSRQAWYGRKQRFRF